MRLYYCVLTKLADQMSRHWFYSCASVIWHKSSFQKPTVEGCQWVLARGYQARLSGWGERVLVGSSVWSWYRGTVMHVCSLSHLGPHLYITYALQYSTVEPSATP
jgi:hypothetical protein